MAPGPPRAGSSIAQQFLNCCSGNPVKSKMALDEKTNVAP